MILSGSMVSTGFRAKARSRELSCNHGLKAVVSVIPGMHFGHL